MDLQRAAVHLARYRKLLIGGASTAVGLYCVHRMVPHEATFRRYLKDLGLFDGEFRALVAASDVSVERHWFTADCTMWGPADGKTPPKGAPAEWRRRYTGFCTNWFIEVKEA